MSNLQFKRFDSMKDSKNRIIENTKKQINNSKYQTHNGTRKGFYISSILITSCLFFWGLFELITLENPSTKQGTEPELISFTGVLEGTLYYSNEKVEFSFSPNEESLNEYPEFKEKIPANTRLLIPKDTGPILTGGREDYSSEIALFIDGLKLIDNSTYLIVKFDIVE